MSSALADVASECHDEILIHAAGVADQLRLGRRLRGRWRCIGPTEVNGERRCVTISR
jgi:hypothetical protein